MQAFIPRAADQRLHLLAKSLRISAGIVQVEGFLVLPDADQREMVRAARLLQDFEAGAARFFQRLGGEGFKRRHPVLSAGRHQINMRYYVHSALCAGRASQQENQQKSHGEIVQDWKRNG
jgi:hypothetical protein